MTASVGLLRILSNHSNFIVQCSNRSYEQKEPKNVLHFVFSTAFDIVS